VVGFRRRAERQEEVFETVFHGVEAQPPIAPSLDFCQGKEKKERLVGSPPRSPLPDRDLSQRIQQFLRQGQLPGSAVRRAPLPSLMSKTPSGGVIFRRLRPAAAAS